MRIWVPFLGVMVSKGVSLTLSTVVNSFLTIFKQLLPYNKLSLVNTDTSISLLKNAEQIRK